MNKYHPSIDSAIARGNPYIPMIDNTSSLFSEPLLRLVQMEARGQIYLAFSDCLGHCLTLTELNEIIDVVQPFYNTVSDKEIEILNKTTEQQLHKEHEIMQRNPTKEKMGKCPCPGYIYVLKSGPYYKIGASRNIDKRIEQLATLPPFDIKLVCSIQTKDMFGLEHSIHKHFNSKRGRGEWFELEPDDIKYIEGLAK